MNPFRHPDTADLIFAELKIVVAGQKTMTALLTELLKESRSIMSEQSHLDALDTQIEADTQKVLAAVAELKSQPGAEVLDFSKIDAAVAGDDAAAAAVEGLETPAMPADPGVDGSAA